MIKLHEYDVSIMKIKADLWLSRSPHGFGLQILSHVPLWLASSNHMDQSVDAMAIQQWRRPRRR